MKICSKVKSVTKANTFTVIKTDAVDLRIWFLTDDIIRIRAGFDGEFAEESYSLMLTGWEDRMDELFGKKRARIAPVMPEIEENETSVCLKGNRLNIVIEKTPLCIKFPLF